MSLAEVRRVADAVLYEGYILYPYRASAQKNRSRWQFGVLMPPGYAAADPSESSTMRAECVFEHHGQPAVEVTVRFLQVQRRRTDGAAGHPAPDPAQDPGSPGRMGRGRRAGSHVDRAQPALLGERHRHPVHRAGRRGHRDDVRRTRRPPPRAPDRDRVGARDPAAGPVAGRQADSPGNKRIGVPAAFGELGCDRRAEGAGRPREDTALPGAFVAAHLIITVSGGAFLSMTDPPEWASPQVSACQNTGCWPVLAGAEGSREVMLAAPIILPDHPQVARESPGELYDGTEIDEILTLRTLALSAEEKAAARATDPRAAALIDRVDAMDAPTMAQLHGTIRAMSAHRPARAVNSPPRRRRAGPVVGPWRRRVRLAWHRLRRGRRPPGRPRQPGDPAAGTRRADAQDMFLAGRAALVEAVLLDVDDTAYLAVTLADDPAADLQSAHGRFLYFAPDEVEPGTAAPDADEAASQRTSLRGAQGQ